MNKMELTDEFGVSAAGYRRAMRSWAMSYVGYIPGNEGDPQCLAKAVKCRRRAQELEVAANEANVPATPDGTNTGHHGLTARDVLRQIRAYAKDELYDHHPRSAAHKVCRDMIQWVDRAATIHKIDLAHTAAERIQRQRQIFP
jgi:dihydroxyacid dehydratase/phosphogluconate dehydratase